MKHHIILFQKKNITWYNLYNPHWRFLPRSHCSVGPKAADPNAPPPRSNHSTCLHENSVVLFGGHGGQQLDFFLEPLKLWIFSSPHFPNRHFFDMFICRLLYFSNMFNCQFQSSRERFGLSAQVWVTSGSPSTIPGYWIWTISRLMHWLMFQTHPLFLWLKTILDVETNWGWDLFCFGLPHFLKAFLAKDYVSRLYVVARCCSGPMAQHFFSEHFGLWSSSWKGYIC